VVLETRDKKIIYHARALFPLMRDFPNIDVGTSNFVGPGYIERAAREYGAGRLLFGSFLPVNDPAVSLGMILHRRRRRPPRALPAGIDEREKERVLRENARAVYRL
jgi:predicted TIM-barrel fold metal-dependent hydrolase